MGKPKPKFQLPSKCITNSLFLICEKEELFNPIELNQIKLEFNFHSDIFPFWSLPIDQLFRDQGHSAF